MTDSSPSGPGETAPPDLGGATEKGEGVQPCLERPAEATEDGYTRSETTLKEIDGYTIVTWDGAKDPRCPFNWSLWKKTWVVRTQLCCPTIHNMLKRRTQVVVICFQILWATMLSAIYASAADGIAEEMHVSPLVARIPQATYLLGLLSSVLVSSPSESPSSGFSVGPVILTPLAEDYGRKWIYTGCIIILYLLQIPCALAHSIATLIVVRFIAGCFASPLLNVGAWLMLCARSLLTARAERRLHPRPLY